MLGIQPALSQQKNMDSSLKLIVIPAHPDDI